MATDDFNRDDENPLSDGDNWLSDSSGHNDLQVVSNAVQAVSNTAWGNAYYTGSFSDAQYSEVECYTQDYNGPSVRAGSDGDFYTASVIGGNRVRLFKGATTLATYNTAYVSGAVCRLEIDAAGNLTTTYNSVELGTYDDTADPLGSGASGIMAFATAGSTLMDNWEGGDLGGGSSSATVGGTLSAITSGQADQVFVDSDLVATLAAITSVFSVQTVNERTAVLEATLAAITSLSDAEVLVSGDLAGELTAVTALFENQVLIDAIIAGDLTAITAAIISSAVPTRSVTIAGTLAAITSVITGEALITCGITGSLTPITSSFQITIEVQNSIATSLQAIEAVIEANVLVSGDVVAALAAITGMIRARTAVASGISGFPCIDGGSLSILGG